MVTVGGTVFGADAEGAGYAFRPNAAELKLGGNRRGPF
jgi:hypothetical protein